MESIDTAAARKTSAAVLRTGLGKHCPTWSFCRRVRGLKALKPLRQPTWTSPAVNGITCHGAEVVWNNSAPRGTDANTQTAGARSSSLERLRAAQPLTADTRMQAPTRPRLEVARDRPAAATSPGAANFRGAGGRVPSASGWSCAKDQGAHVLPTRIRCLARVDRRGSCLSLVRSNNICLVLESSPRTLGGCLARVLLAWYSHEGADESTLVIDPLSTAQPLNLYVI